MLQPYPEADLSRVDAEACIEMQWVMDLILGVRQIRSGMNIDPRRSLPVMIQNGSETDRTRLAANRHYLENVGKVASITWLDVGASAPESATVLVGEMKLLIPMAGLIDKEAELQRLAREIEKRAGELDRCEAKLANPSFVDKAPEPVVQKERERAVELQSALVNLRAQQARIAAL